MCAPVCTKRYLLSQKKPVSRKHSILDRRVIPWTLNDLRKQLGREVLQFRLSKAHGNGIEWESDADLLKSNIDQFLAWCSGEMLEEENPFSSFPCGEYWAYSGYNYMDKTFSEECSLMKAVDWSSFGFEGRGSRESVFWIGSPGSYTPCHMDTYGCNLIAQVIGRKQWILFPPDDIWALYPTRIPYEESSIFSSVDVLNPNLQKYPLFQKCHPHVITLEPGDVLFVPPKWWHYVQNLDVSVSINTWIELDSDDEPRLNEAITATLMSVLVPAFDTDSNEMSWLNPNQDLMSPEEAVECIESFLRKIGDSTSSERRENDDEPVESGPHIKVPRLDESISDCRSTDSSKMSVFQEVRSITFTEYEETFCSKNLCCSERNSKDVSKHFDKRAIINCFVHPDVISCIAEKLGAL